MLADFIGLLESLTASPWFLPLVFLIALADAVFPLVPSETAVIVGGVAAGFGQISVWSVILAAALGAIAGDSIAYQLGQRTGDFLRRRSPDRSLRRFGWAQKVLQNRAGLFIVTARFIPGGRTAVTFASGVTRLRLSRFTGFVVLAGIVWATYAALLGFVFGRRFQEDHTQAFLFAFGSALVLVALAELIRWMLSRRHGARFDRSESSESVNVG
ncbi:MAG TPA: DedA family protein [Acidimicrobiia bacterium]|nr:DedA family protein [Acidimicrobiia bacterium]